MSDPIFVSVEDVELYHDLSIERYGGTRGLRDRGAFESAVEQPKQTYYYGHGDLFDIAAAYAFHIAQAQAFLDGNKRTAVAATLAFLDMNEAAPHANDIAIYNAMIAIAERRCDKTQLAALLRGSN